MGGGGRQSRGLSSAGGSDWEVRRFLEDVEGLQLPASRRYAAMRIAFGVLMAMLPVVAFAVLWIWFGGRRSRLA